MKKLILLVVLFGMFIFPGVVFAHTDLKMASPAENAVMKSEVNEITLDFNTRIGSISTMTVSNDIGSKLEFASIEVVEKRMIGKLVTPLENGAYTVQWRIAGLDGHIIERSYGFEVHAPAKVDQVEPTPANSNELNDKMESDASKMESTPQQQKTEVEEKGFSSVVWLLVGGMIVLIISLFVLVLKKKRI